MLIDLVVVVVDVVDVVAIVAAVVVVEIENCYLLALLISSYHLFLKYYQVNSILLKML